jgi:hypothetical protein
MAGNVIVEFEFYQHMVFFQNKTADSLAGKGYQRIVYC